MSLQNLSCVSPLYIAYIVIMSNFMVPPLPLSCPTMYFVKHMENLIS